MNAPIPTSSLLKKRKHCETTLYKSMASAFNLSQMIIKQMPKDIKYGCNERITCTMFDLSHLYRQAYEENNLVAKLDFLNKCIFKSRELETYILFLFDSYLSECKISMQFMNILGDIFNQLLLWVESVKNKLKKNDEYSQ